MIIKTKDFDVCETHIQTSTLAQLLMKMKCKSFQMESKLPLNINSSFF